jgi:Restriction alleviation protein Lar
MSDLIIIGDGFREKLKELKAEIDRKLIYGDRDPSVVLVPDPITAVPCPFCGGHAKVDSKVNYGHGDSTCEVYVLCQVCSAHGPSSGNYGLPTSEQKKMAVELWEGRIIIKTSEI